MQSQYTDKEEKADVEGYILVCFYLIQWRKEFSVMPVCILKYQHYPQSSVNKIHWLFRKWKTLSTGKDTAVMHLKAV